MISKPKTRSVAACYVADHFRRRVPDPELFAQSGIEGFQKRLVEIGNRLAFVEPREERLPINPVERGDRPVEHFDESERLQPSRLR